MTKRFQCILICDGCGSASEPLPASTITRANTLASVQGWGQARTAEYDLVDLCPACMDRHEERLALAEARRKRSLRRAGWPPSGEAP
jgi:hypothetical protein